MLLRLFGAFGTLLFVIVSLHSCDAQARGRGQQYHTSGMHCGRSCQETMWRLQLAPPTGTGLRIIHVPQDNKDGDHNDDRDNDGGRTGCCLHEEGTAPPR